MQSDDNLFGDVIYSYTREQALEDGVLIDISKTAKETGIKFPTAITQQAWEYMIENQPNNTESEIDAKTWDVCFMLVVAIKNSINSTNTLRYPVVRIVGTKTEEVQLKAVVGAGDSGEPVMTIMLPSED